MPVSVSVSVSETLLAIEGRIGYGDGDVYGYGLGACIVRAGGPRLVGVKGVDPHRRRGFEGEVSYQAVCLLNSARNSSRTLRSAKQPLSADVVVIAPGFFTPRISTHR